MSSAEAERRRREIIASLKSKRLGDNKAPSSGSNGHVSSSSHPPRSPESQVLVPSSSSPVAATTPKPNVSKFFNTAKTNGEPSSSTQRTLWSKPSSNIPSSKLGSNVNGNAASNDQRKGSTAGTPQSVMSAIINRRQAENIPRENNHNSLSYENRADDSATSSRPDLSPSSPQPLSRLKNKYTEESPQQSRSYVDSPGSPQAKGNLSRTPSLIQMAQKAQDGNRVETPEERNFVDKLKPQFPNVSRAVMLGTFRQFSGDWDASINRISTYSDRIEAGRAPPLSFSSPQPSATTSSWKSSSNKPSTSSTSASASFTKPLPFSSSVKNGSSSSSSTPVKATLPSPAKVAKPKKNEKSRIYANRENGKGKRRDPDDSESEAEAGGGASDVESEMSWSGDEGRRKKRRKGDDDELDAEGEALKAFNEVDADMLTGTIACSAEQAAKIISLRPFEDAEEVYAKLNKARGVSSRLFEQYTEIMEGYVQIDACLNRCEAIASDVANTLSIWRGASLASDSVVGTPRSDGLNDVKVDVAKVSELLKRETDWKKKKILSQYIQYQPPTLGEGTVLKDYQLLGVNWLNLLYSKKIGCILADEMGLGKTIQVIAFLSHLKEKGMKGPHMIFVPASTLENWIREFERFGPSIDVQTYYGSQAERAGLRDDLKRKFRKGRLEVVLASYTQVAAPDDLSFFRKKIEFETCIYDEGHRLKSCTTKAYADLMSIKPRWRLLLTGTPLQNNLQELVSLLMFIHKDVFNDAEPYLRAIFKSQGHASLLSQQRVSRARTMLTPFVLRRRKAHVLDLPPKIETVRHCEMTKVQAKLYRETLQRSKKVLEEMDEDSLEAAADEVEDDGSGGKVANGKPKKKTKKDEDKKKSSGLATSSSNILMDLRKAASHPMLFRRLYTDAKVRQIARECLNTPKWCDSNFDYVVEDLEIMSDADIHHFCEECEYDSIKKFALPPSAFLEGGKIQALKKLIEKCKKEGKRMLLFSQFVMILDILEVALDHLGIKFTRLDGSTKTDERQEIVDEFTDNEDITIFLLSTKAGGVGINLVAASVVVIYDQDFNPHNDRQAADRAYRIGQDKDVEVIKLITKDSIDEDMLAIGVTKLQLDDAVGGEEITLDGEAAGPGQKDDKTAKEVRKSLLTTLRNKFEAGDDSKTGSRKVNGAKVENKIQDIKEEEEIMEVETPRKRVARGGPATQAT